MLDGDIYRLLSGRVILVHTRDTEAVILPTWHCSINRKNMKYTREMIKLKRSIMHELVPPMTLSAHAPFTGEHDNQNQVRGVNGYATLSLNIIIFFT